jgi:NitT/TauT family transport system substrate-binding protein
VATPRSRWIPRRALVTAALCALAALGVTACGGSDKSAGSADASGGQAKKLTLGLTVGTSFEVAMPPQIAVEQGIFKKAGLDVKVVAFQGGADLVKGLVSGAVDVGLGTGFDGVSAGAQGVPLKMFGSYMNDSPIYFAAKKNGKVKTLDDLRGAKFGITRFGSLTDFVARVTARAKGLDPSKDMKIVALGGAPEQMAALKRGTTDVFAFGIDVPAQLETQGAGTIIGSFAEIFPGGQHGVFEATDSYLKDNRQTAQRLMKAYFDTITWMKAHKPEVIASAQKFLNLTPKVAELTYDKLMPLYSTDGAVNVDGLRKTAQTLPDLQVAPKVPDVDALVQQLTPAS